MFLLKQETTATQIVVVVSPISLEPDQPEAFHSLVLTIDRPRVGGYSPTLPSLYPILNNLSTILPDTSLTKLLPAFHLSLIAAALRSIPD